MTAIAAFVDAKKTVWMGGDSAATGSRWDQSLLVHPKVFVKKSMVIGYAGSVRMANILEHCFDPPAREVDDAFDGYICTSFLPALRDAFAAHCFAKGGAGEHMPSEVLIGHQGQIFRIQSDFGLLRRTTQYDAIGSGEDICVGAMHVMCREKNADGKKIIARALQAAADNNATVRSPFTIVSLSRS